MKRLTLIDLDSIRDIVAYQAIEHDSPIIVESTVLSFIDEILTNTAAEAYAGFYQKEGHKNFRKIIFPGYKGKRPPTPDYKVKWRPLIHETFKSYSGTTGLEIIESDDALSIMYHKYKDKYEITLAHIDKDLNCLPGTHYNYNAKNVYRFTENESKFHFCTQVLSGDSGDSIPGVPGIGPAKAKKFLFDNTTLIKAYKAASKSKKVETWIRNFYRDYHCIRLLQDIDELSKFTEAKEVDIFNIDEFNYEDDESGIDQDNMYELEF